MTPCILTAPAGAGGDPPPSGPDVLFHSTWNTATGSSAAAVTDGSVWDNPGYCSRDDVMSVVAAGTASSPRPGNVFRVQFQDGTGSGCGQVEKLNAVGQGQSHYGRMFFCRRDRTYDGSIHNFSYNFVGSIQHIFFIPNARSASGWRVGIGGLPEAFPYTYWNLQSGPGSDVFNPPYVLLDYDTWYLYEWHIEYRSGGARFRIYPRISTAAGVLLYDASSFYQMSTPTQGTYTLQQWYNDGNDFAVSDATLHRHVGIGNEGRTGSPSSGLFFDVADFALATGGWIGAAVL